MARLVAFDTKGIARARARGNRSHTNDAKLVSFLPSASQVRLSLRNGTEVTIPLEAISQLRKVAKSDLKKLRLSHIGDALELPGLDIHVSVAGLVRKAIFGEDLYSKAGRTKTRAKAIAARSNGRKGGRPKVSTAA